MKFDFTDLVERGKPYTYNVGERALADKLFWVLCGLDAGYTGTISGDGLCFNRSSFNNVLALGDRTMFIRGSVRRNIYKALRLRTDKKTAMARTDEVIGLYNLRKLETFNVKLLTGEELITVALARAHFRKIGLVVFNKVSTNVEIDLQKFSDAYIITIC
jgi:ABC-type nitrate/sulfonate/bicarbonate transport system ATPase subunit